MIQTKQRTPSYLDAHDLKMEFNWLVSHIENVPSLYADNLSCLVSFTEAGLKQHFKV